ncbi:MAG: hypothetical protein PWQ91_484 [Eubacteriales bacterium]|nr:hypothetical protein [Eubacteriales bacterium]MDN5363423.1 hypothetical protein [Eubacteriales bacterium]
MDRRTKNLVKRLQPGEIAVIDHEDLDEVAAESLLACRVKAVINAAPSISGRYPTQGPLVLVEGGVLLLDEVGKEIMEIIQEEDEIEIIGDGVFRNGKLLARGTVLTPEMIRKKLEETRANMGKVLEEFVRNTLQYAQREQELILGPLNIPDTRVKIRGRHVLIVVRGQNYKEDLQAIRTYISEMKPVLIGVDGGADALREMGYQPDIIIGDMDSISDETLRSGAEIIVHAYPDGRAPGLARVEKLGLSAKVFPAPGTSEDIAMLLAYEKGAELIVAVGTHSSMIDFLEKGRKGMASTFLVRLKVGSILVDAKGVSKLYRQPLRLRYLAEIVAAALIPVFIVALASPTVRSTLHLLWLKFKVLMRL